MILDYDRPESWPTEIAVYLDQHREALEDWGSEQRFTTGYQYDAIIAGLGDLLRPHEILSWHCTRLLSHEAAEILANGLHLPSAVSLTARIEAARAIGAFPTYIAEGFKRRHQADSPSRAGRIWFLFTRPCRDDGVEDFFRFWGGESLYAAIDRDPELGPVLRSVGVPSVVEAAIPISYFHDSLGYDNHIARQFCSWRAGQPYDGVPHDRARTAIPANHIRRIVSFHDEGFAGLTGCDQYWEPLFCDPQA